MSLAKGTRLGAYEIVGPLGAGGMGEVYRAKDTKLDRQVAVKVLPDGVVSNAEKLARFKNEAKTLASLNHVNIAAIYGLEEVAGVPYFVLELVEGESLDIRLSRGEIDLKDTLALSIQIASAIEAAHERGIVHRDLKPGNIMITPSGTVKVLDFGLAKSGAVQWSGSDSRKKIETTVTASPTKAGVIIGTVAYMSPEQARGLAVDTRSDIWSFGCVLFECLAGHPPFTGETNSDLIARILEREPDWDALPSTAPSRVRDILKRCLRKDLN
ncbi:MAG: serine/threonine-protein kinase, partial [Candidatus Zixiibacteriota bacterium]